MNDDIQRIQNMWPNPPADAVESLAHTLDAFYEAPDDQQVIIATSGFYPDRTGLTLGDLRELKKILENFHG